VYEFPLSGLVTASESKAFRLSNTANADPYSAGWIVLLDPAELRSDLKELYFGIESVKFVEGEAERLLSMITDDPKAAAATGGEPIRDVYGAFREKGWDPLVKKLSLSFYVKDTL